MQKGANSKETVVVGVSGGVDSSVALLLLKKQGFNVVGLHIKTADEKTAKDEENFARQICDKIGAELVVIDSNNDMDLVKSYFVSEYKNGRTPNPCVVCNRDVKLKPIVDYAKKIGAKFFATGHYAKIIHNENGDYLLAAKDEDKDQTYFLNSITKEQLKMALFPLGELTKSEVRKIAEDNGFVNAHKKDSFDVCFIGSEKFKDYMNKNFPARSGNIVDAESGKIVGKHNGLNAFTIGQRKGLEIGGGHGKTGECWFVVRKDLKTNTLFVSQGDDERLYSNALTCEKFNWLGNKPENEFECFAKFRYRQKGQPVSVKIDGNRVEIYFKEKQRAITEGQFAVLYQKRKDFDELICLGGGPIEEIKF